MADLFSYPFLLLQILSSNVRIHYFKLHFLEILNKQRKTTASDTSFNDVFAPISSWAIKGRSTTNPRNFLISIC